ncbi:MAG: DUF5615 family PIN-like protein [Acidobacteria bacterium]|nr:DUF5615 family PIN-like protein [Acidobacteriota bacterium]MBK8147249.1 DUF5615 family PIN-like protein [Acidobacteriota bacterium]MBK8810412.1 DUF5615 family PIN-like protein [Acidobacteriota bacterium]
MRFLVDAQPPKRLATRLIELGYDAVHTLDLPLGNRTPDSLISEISINEERVVITKDSDFVDSYLLAKKPKRLLLISTGNIRNSELEFLFLMNIQRLTNAFNDGFEFIELSQTAIVIHS